LYEGQIFIFAQILPRLDSNIRDNHILRRVAVTMEKRIVGTKTQVGLRSISNLILVGVLLAAGAVLKLVLGSAFTVMKPNFVISMYCLAILLIRVNIVESIIIGLLAGAVCQFFPGTPYINFASELTGALAMALLMKIPMRFKKLNVKPLITTFFSTLVSGFTFIGVLYLAFYAGANVTPTPLVLFLGIILGTATLNAVIVQLIYPPLRAALKKEAA
jgi:hypothetical protein